MEPSTPDPASPAKRHVATYRFLDEEEPACKAKSLRHPPSRHRRPDLGQIPHESAMDVLRHGITLTELQHDLDQHGSDGCTIASNTCTPCCWLHDALWRLIKRGSSLIDHAGADRIYRRCIIAMGREDEWWWRPKYFVSAWMRWAAVRTIGRLFR